jgi:hypothetical protein
MMYRDSVACIAVCALCPIPVIGTKYRAIMYEIQQKWVLNTQPVLVAIEMLPLQMHSVLDLDGFLSLND